MNFNKSIAGSILLLTFLANSAFAQNGNAGGSTSQAVLTIQVNVVPMIALQRSQPMIQNTGAIAYNIPVQSTRKTVTEKTREGFVIDESGKSQLRPVTTITVVAE
jgi:hypothetical protein